MILTTASKITIVRIVMIPVVLILMYSDFAGHMYWAIGVFILAALTDALDGYIARHYNQVSNLGKFLDPLADKLLVISVLCVLTGWGQMPVWALIVVLVRELSVQGLRLVAVEGGKVIAAAWSGKIKTASTMVCIVIMMLPFVTETVNIVCWCVIAATTVWSGVEYFIKNADVFKS